MNKTMRFLVVVVIAFIILILSDIACEDRPVESPGGVRAESSGPGPISEELLRELAVDGSSADYCASCVEW